MTWLGARRSRTRRSRSTPPAWTTALYTESQGRLFTPGGMSIDRQFRGWADEMNKEGLLDGKTVGVVAGDQPQEFLNGVNEALLPELEKLGHKAAQVVDVAVSPRRQRRRAISTTPQPRS